MKRIVYILFCVCVAVMATVTLVPQRCAAQMPIKYNIVRQVMPDSTDLAYYGKKHFWRAAGEVVGFNIGLWAFDRYVQHGDWAYINLNTIKENFKHGFIWDNDQLGTNTFLHPYNGSLYYAAGRSNGFNYWQSELFAIAGSAMWELFMECEYPSTNDVIATPIGGAVLGETLFRASDALLDDRTGNGTFRTGICIIPSFSDARYKPDCHRTGMAAQGNVRTNVRHSQYIHADIAWHKNDGISRQNEEPVCWSLDVA